jgi:xanthine dehydrogenase YagR molybdenum-binding subunit
VVTDYMGGGFGSKLGQDVQVLIAAKLAKAANAAVKIMCDRKTEHLITGNRPSAYAKVKAGADAQGKFVAWDAETWGTGGAGAGAGFPLPYQVYVWPNRRRTHRDVYINAGPQRAFRAPGHPQGCFITEVVVDELADRLRMDPLELRLRNLPEDQPNQQWRKYFPIGAEKIGWSKRHPTGDSAAGPIKRGLGCAANRWAGAGNPQTRASCEIMPDGSVLTRIATQDIGTGTRTLVAMITAETMGLPLEAVQAKIGDTNYPFAPGSGGSITVASVSATVRPACEAARDALFAKVAPGLGVEPASLVARNGRIQSKSDASKGLSWKEACRQLGTASATGDGAFDRTLATVGTSGVQFADVEVDIETGVTRVRRIACVQDCGMILDKLTAESQCLGGIIMGTGFALYENRILDRTTALMVNPNMEFYLLPGMSDVPQIDVTLIDQADRGVVGLGEPPVISTAAAIANAVANAIGTRIRKLPISPDTVLAALEQERAGGTQ